MGGRGAEQPGLHVLVEAEEVCVAAGVMRMVLTLLLLLRIEAQKEGGGGRRQGC